MSTDLYTKANNDINQAGLDHKKLIWEIERDWIVIGLRQFNAQHFISPGPVFKKDERIKRGLMHEQGLGGPFNYQLACAWSHDDFNSDRAKRVKKLASIKFDQLLNSVRSEVEELTLLTQKDMTQLFPTNEYNEELEAAKTLLTELQAAAQTFISGNQMETDQDQFFNTISSALKTAKPKLINNSAWTPILKAASIIICLLFLGFFPYMLGRSICGLFSARIDVAKKLEKLDSLLSNHQTGTMLTQGSQ